MKGALPFDYGVSLVEGMPGSGKSYIALRWSMIATLIQRRPVYTNLPIKFRVLRTWLRNQAGPEVANLLNPLPFDFAERAFQRAHDYRTFRDERLRLARRQGVTIPDELLDQEWQELHGPNLTNSERNDANWLPLGSLIIYDEVQNDYPMRMPGNSKEGETLKRYLSCHRHFGHQFIGITQDRMQVSLTIRRLCNHYWKVLNKSDQRIAWGIKFKHLGLLAFGYAKWDTHAEQLPPHHDGHRPIAQFVVYPRFGFNRQIFRFYESFTGAGSPRRIIEMVERARLDAGLNADGTTHTERQRQEEKAMRLNAKRRSFLRRLVRRIVLVPAIALLLVVGFALGRVGAPPAELDVELVDSESAEPQESQEPPTWPTLTSIGPNWVRINSARLSVGMVSPEGFRLVMLDPAERVAIVSQDDHYALLRPRHAPFYLGTSDVLVQAASKFGIEGNDSMP